MKAGKAIRIILILSLIFVNIGCDQVSKAIVRENVDTYEQINIIDKIFILTKVENTGAFLSLGSSLPPILKNILLLSFPAIVLLFTLYMLIFKKDLHLSVIIGLCFIIGGGVGNLYDRIIYGSVTDFLHIDLGIVRTGVFNVADMSIMAGTALILIQSFYNKNKKSTAEPLDS